MPLNTLIMELTNGMDSSLAQSEHSKTFPEYSWALQGWLSDV